MNRKLQVRPTSAALHRPGSSALMGVTGSPKRPRAAGRAGVASQSMPNQTSMLRAALEATEQAAERRI